MEGSGESEKDPLPGCSLQFSGTSLVLSLPLTHTTHFERFQRWQICNDDKATIGGLEKRPGKDEVQHFSEKAQVPYKDIVRLSDGSG